MSVLLILVAVLILGFTAVGLVGFLGWRQRMRESLPASDHRQVA